MSSYVSSFTRYVKRSLYESPYVTVSAFITLTGPAIAIPYYFLLPFPEAGSKRPAPIELSRSSLSKFPLSAKENDRNAAIVSSLVDNEIRRY